MLDVAGRDSIYMNGLGLSDSLSFGSTQRPPDDVNSSFAASDIQDISVHFVDNSFDNAVLSLAGKKSDNQEEFHVKH